MPEISIEGPDGAFGAYLALPATTPAPGLVVAQEIFGVNQVMREVCDWLAGAGYVACCPDLFWRIEPGIQITDKTDAEWERAFELFGLFDVDKGVVDLKATLAGLRAQEACNGILCLWRAGTAEPWSREDRSLLAEVSGQIGLTNRQLARQEPEVDALSAAAHVAAVGGEADAQAARRGGGVGGGAQLRRRPQQPGGERCGALSHLSRPPPGACPASRHRGSGSSGSSS